MKNCGSLLAEIVHGAWCNVVMDSLASSLLFHNENCTSVFHDCDFTQGRGGEELDAYVTAAKGSSC